MKSQTIGLVLNTLPKYSETFFRNKIVGLQEKGFEVVLFVEYQSKLRWPFRGKVIVADDHSKSTMQSVIHSLKALFRTIFKHPKQSIDYYKLDRNDGVPLASRLKRLLKNEFLLREPVDWLHFGFGMLVMGRENIAQAIGAKMAVSFRGSDLYLSPLIHHNCYKVLFSKSCKYHVLSNEMLNDLIDLKINKNAIRVITPAIDIDFFKPKNDKPPNEMLQITTVARLHWKKGLEYTLDALKILKEMGVEFNYHLIGAGPEFERLKFATYQHGLESQVHFLGRLNQEDIQAQLSHTDIYIQYSIQEGFCNAVIEAQAMKCICVVSNAEGLSENVINGETGFVIPKRQPEQLAHAIKKVVQLSEEKRTVIETSASSRVLELFSIEKQIDQFERFYSE